MKYTPEMLADAAKRSTTMAGVLRLLGIRPSGGAHAHIRRRLNGFGIDTTHFTGQGHTRGQPSSNRLTPYEILVLRPAHVRRAPGSQLTRALVTIGVPLRCAACGVGPEWNERPLVLHVDHINGDYCDCRPENLRFLCPNCHSQTSNFAGRGKRPEERSPQLQRRPSAPADTPLTVRQAAQLLGCSTNHFYRLRRELGMGAEKDGRLAQERADRNAKVIECALAFPDEGPRKIAARLRDEATAG